MRDFKVLASEGQNFVATLDDFASVIFSRYHWRQEKSRALAAQRDPLMPGLVSGALQAGNPSVKLQEVVG
jgi:hypothetical protein